MTCGGEGTEAAPGASAGVTLAGDHWSYGHHGGSGIGGVTVFMSESEEIFLDLWQQYYKSINIKGRKNLRQMRNYMPERYWKNLSEKQEKTEDF